MTDTESPGAICARWWHQALGGDDALARTTRARLRRCTTASEALAVDAVHDLNARLRAMEFPPGAGQLALIAIALAHVSESGERGLAAEFGGARGRMARARSASSAFKPSFAQRVTPTSSPRYAVRWRSCAELRLLSRPWRTTSFSGTRTPERSGASSTLTPPTPPPNGFHRRAEE